MPEMPDGVPEDDNGRIFPLPDGRGDGSSGLSAGLMAGRLARIPSITFPKGGHHDRAGQHGWRYRGRQPGDR
jgi:hypothetical protein